MVLHRFGQELSQFDRRFDTSNGLSALARPMKAEIHNDHLRLAMFRSLPIISIQGGLYEHRWEEILRDKWESFTSCFAMVSLFESLVTGK